MSHQIFVSPLPSSDHNWRNGVAAEWSSAFLIGDSPQLRKILTTFPAVTFCDGQERLVTGISPGNENTLIVFVNGAPLDGSTVGWPNEIRIAADIDVAESAHYTPRNINIGGEYYKGVAISDANCAALAIANIGRAKRILQPGACINFENWSQRKILSVEDCGHFLRVVCDGSAFDPDIYGYPNRFSVDGIFVSNTKLEGMRKYACRGPFENFDIQFDGRVFFCCPLFTNGYALGNIFQDDIDSIWNGERARRFRRSVSCGDFEYCNDLCYFLSEAKQGKIPDQDSVLVAREQFSSWIGDTDDCNLSYMPTSITIQLDRSCNLVCKSCRKSKYIKNSEQSEKLRELLEAKIRPLLQNCEALHLMASGEVLASKAMTSFMKSLSATDFPRLRYGLISNGQLLSNKKWEEIFEPSGIPVAYISLSIDAANKETYEKLRLGGSWTRLIKNIKFMQRQRQTGKIGKLYFNFLVQKENFRQIREFLQLAVDFSVDAVFFQRISFNMDMNYSDDEKREINVCSPDHPDYKEVVETLASLQNNQGITVYNNCF
ncbi:MAG: SPASM domain-containing protein [Rhodospirillales bacterium]|nr:SPASM domain-containing protein [Rhodospirillales bacterium]